ncbi:ROK family transcriptional regulator [Streptomyces sp. V4-01]|uniref:ROK family transcriptional regulator n=1 Tax=Actinacidiphila polyblastidii TaxID=3110430 RepID=A0ABU7P8N4_9ACTN|nr:ROK family transcriptional regulator [Streptomyces sp. V4-01]
MHPSASGANLPVLRGHNAALVLDLLRAAARADGGLSRADLAERTGLTPQAVSKITARLRTRGLIEESGHRAPTGGKPRTGLRLAAGARHAVGVHLDGERLTAVLTDLAGRQVGERTAPLDLGRPVDEALGAVAAEIRATAATASGPVIGAGVGIRGPLDHRTGVLHRVTGFPHWEGCRLRDELARRLGLPVAVDKNTNAAALAVLAAGPVPAAGPAAGTGVEAGAGTGVAIGARGGGATVGSFAYLHLGTGLGAGLVLDGALHRGGRTGAGEFGHQAVQLDGPPCKCGNRGCLEALCLAAVARGDLRGAAALLGVGAANLVALLDIDRVVLGGRTVQADPGGFRAGVAEVLAARGRRVPVAVAPPLAVAEGAALLVLAPFFTAAALG